MFNCTFCKRNKKECIKSYINFKKLVQQKHAPLYENTCSLDVLDEKPNHIKLLKFWNFEGKGCRAKDWF
jgi:hypothetical protein